MRIAYLRAPITFPGIAGLASCITLCLGFVTTQSGHAADAPTPLVAAGHPADWWFVFKFNTAAFPACSGGAGRLCPFGGQVQASYKQSWGQQFVYASSDNVALQKGSDCLGDTTADPVGATFDEVYNGSLHYVVWNDQFYDDPKISGCTKECGSPWGHSKGALAWDDSGNGLVMQVTTPSWPAAGSAAHPRTTDGNSLGCVNDDDVLVSQHFFSLKLTKDDVVTVLQGLQNASVVTDPTNPQIVSNGGPADIQALVSQLGQKSTNVQATKVTLSSGVILISKPSRLHVPPWQMVSALLDGVPLRAATWWARPTIETTTSDTAITCWDDTLAKPGPVEIAAHGQFEGVIFGLTGGLGPNFNHAKVGVSTSGAANYSIFGDMNQQGTLSGANCGSSQNGRGGLFYVINNADLLNSVSALIKGDTPAAVPAPP